MARELPWPKPIYVTLKQPAATLDGKLVIYTEKNAGSGPFGSAGRLEVGKANAQGKHPVYIVFTLHGEHTFEHALALHLEHVDSLEPMDFATERAHYCCRRVIES